MKAPGVRGTMAFLLMFKICNECIPSKESYTNLFILFPFKSKDMSILECSISEKDVKRL